MLAHSFDRFYVVTRIEIPSHPYVLLNRMILCNCIIEVENNFLLESIAAGDPEGDGADLEMYFVANTAFLNYFDELINTLNSTYNEVAFNEKLPITKQYLCTKYTYSPINKSPLMKSHL